MHFNNYSLQNWFFKKIIHSDYSVILVILESVGLHTFLFKSLFYVIMIQNIPWKEDIEGRKSLYS